MPGFSAETPIKRADTLAQTMCRWFLSQTGIWIVLKNLQGTGERRKQSREYRVKYG
jgi:hypothetical protein